MVSVGRHGCELGHHRSSDGLLVPASRSPRPEASSRRRPTTDEQRSQPPNPAVGLGAATQCGGMDALLSARLAACSVGAGRSGSSCTRSLRLSHRRPSWLASASGAQAPRASVGSPGFLLRKRITIARRRSPAAQTGDRLPYLGPQGTQPPSSAKSGK